MSATDRNMGRKEAEDPPTSAASDEQVADATDSDPQLDEVGKEGGIEVPPMSVDFDELKKEELSAADSDRQLDEVGKEAVIEVPPLSVHSNEVKKEEISQVPSPNVATASLRGLQKPGLDEKVSPTTTKRGLRKKNQHLVGPSTPGAVQLVALRGLRKNSQYSHPSRDVEANVNEDAQDERLSDTVGPTNDESRSDRVYAGPEEDSDKPSSENIVEASLVEDREETPIATAEVVDTQAIEKAANRRRRIAYVLVAMLVAVVFGVVLGLRGNDNVSASSNGNVRGTGSEISNGDSSAKPSPSKFPFGGIGCPPSESS